MDAAELVVSLGGVALIALTLWFFFGKRASASPRGLGTVVYACPMHPWITSPIAGTSCSVCGMALVRQESNSP